MSDETPFPRPLSAAMLEPLPAAAFPQREAFEGHTVVMEPLDPARHGEDLLDAVEADDPARWYWLPYGPFGGDRAGFDAHLANCAESEDPLFFAIRCRATGRVEGMASYLEIEPAHAIIEVGHIWLGPRLSRRREATDALATMIAHAMDDLGYRRMQWKCDALNAPSRAAARRLGFRYEGVLHAHRIVKGRNRDTAYYAILAEEWAEIRPRLMAWLSDENFDAEGQARSSLTAAMAAPRVAMR